MSNDLITKGENIQLITTTIPEAYSDNKISRERCLEAGNKILSEIEKGGMNDELDQRAAVYIEKSRKTVAKMYGKRSPVTKLFDEIRGNFTRMEAEIDPSKKDSVPYRIQAYRNEYAARKREEEERKRRQFIEEQNRISAISTYRAEVDGEYKRIFYAFVNNQQNILTALYSDITLENIDDMEVKINAFSDKLDEAYFSNIPSLIPKPYNVSSEELAEIRKKVLAGLLPKFTEQYEGEIIDRKLELSQRIPSKREELERAAKTSAEEAERIQAGIKKRDAEEAAKLEEERKQREQQEAAARALEADKAMANSLFAQQAAMVQGYTPKSKVKQRIKLLNPEGILPIISLWWSEEGCTLSTDELSKLFKKQITFAEKMANANEPRFVEHESVEYVEQVTAK